VRADHTGRSGCDIRMVIPATFEALEWLFEEFRQRSRCVLPPRDYFTAELLAREALTNAIVHGSQGDPSKSVRCALRMRTGKLTISICDEGPGFDWRETRDHSAATCDSSGRGMQIFRMYANRVRFSEKGNAVTLTRDFRLRGKHISDGLESRGSEPRGFEQ